jgi:hypothetical protein
VTPLYLAEEPGGFACPLAAMFPVDHFLVMVLYALLLSLFFGMLWASDRRSRLRLFAKIFGALVLGGLAVAWLMYPFPS